MVWTGADMVVWGGVNAGAILRDGARYNPTGNFWTTLSSTDTPAGRYSHSAVWTGSKMLIWGGYGTAWYLNDLSAYSPPGSMYLYLRP